MIQISPENLVPESAIHQDHPSGPTFSKRTNTCQSQNNKRQNSTFHYHCPCKILTLNRHQNPKEFKKESERKQAELMPPQANPTSHSLRITSFVISNTWFPLLPSWYLQHHSFTLYKPGNPKKTLFTYSPSPRLLLTAKFINPITNKNMLDIWSWICGLPYSTERAESESSLFFALGNSYQDDSSRSIQLRAEMTSGSDSEQVVIFKVYSQGFELDNPPKTLWVSDACPLSSDKPFLPLFLQLLEEIITRSPSAQDSTCPRSLVQKLKPNPIAWIMDSHSPESFSSFFDLVFLTRLFWLCVFDAPSGVGSLYFNAILGPNIEALTYKHAPVLRTFLQLVGVDVELCFMRSLGYIFAKWLILREMGVGLQTLTPLPNQHPGFSYATEAHGFWILKGYGLISAMKQTRSDGNRSFKFPVMDAKESVLRYALAHQHLEAVLQLEYSVEFRDGYIQVNAHVDNLRFHVAKLGFNKNEDLEYADERHFPTRIRVWVGPEVGSTYVSGLSLGRSTKNGEREIETQRNLKGTYGYSKIPKVKARARTTIKTKTKNWRWDQDAEGNAGVFDAVLCDNTTGQELATWNGGSSNSSFRNRYMGGNRPFTKTGGLVFARDEYGEGVGWRLSREMEGSVLKWRIGGQVWLSYWPNKVKSSYRETRLVEWCDEVDLPLIPGK